MTQERGSLNGLTALVRLNGRLPPRLVSPGRRPQPPFPTVAGKTIGGSIRYPI
jgi:hypothetical protein